MSKQNTDYSYEEFLAYVLIYAAHVDLDFSDEEKLVISANTGEETYKKVYADFKEVSDFTALQTIMSYKDKYYATEEEKEKLTFAVKQVFKADGDFSKLEKLVLNFVNRLVS